MVDRRVVGFGILTALLAVSAPANADQSSLGAAVEAARQLVTAGGISPQGQEVPAAPGGEIPGSAVDAWQSSQGQRAELGKPAPDFTLKDLQGRSVTLSQFKGQVVLLDFFATYCAPCWRSTPLLVRLHEHYSDYGLVILGISDESAATLKRFEREHDVPYPFLNGEAGMTAVPYGVRGIPTYFLIGKDGNVVWKQIGFGDELAPGMEEAVRRALLNANQE